MDYSSLLSRPISYFGKEQVWVARGDDVLLFNSHRSNIQNYLKHSGIPESTQSPWIGLYRIGKSLDEARTVLVVSCSDRRIRKLTRNVLRSSPIFQQGGALARFKVISKATPPETATEPELTMQVDGESSVVSLKTENSLEQNVGQDVQRHAQSEITLRLGKSLTGDSYLCRQIQASQWSRHGVLQSQTATAGPLLWLGDSPYQLTVEHVVNFSNRGADTTSKSTEDDWDRDDEDDDDGDDSNDCSFDEEIAPWDIPKAGIRSRTNSWTEGNVSDSASSNTVPELVTASSDADLSSSFQIDDSRPPSFVDTKFARPGGIRDVVIHDFLSPFTSSSIKPPTQCRASSEMDYLLIPVPMGSETQPFIDGTVEIKDPSNAFSVHEHTEPRPVTIATASLGYVNGVMFPASTLSRKPGSQTFHTFFCIESDQDMPKGTSGSAVFDTQTGLLAGYIVLGCPGKNIWYMAPITDVLDDIEANYGIVVRYLMRLNVSANAKRIPQTSIIPSKSRITKAPSQPRLVTLPKPVDPYDWKSQESGTTPGCIDQLSHAQWHRQFGSQPNIAGKPANYQPLSDMIQQYDPEILDVFAFLSPYLYSSRWGRHASLVEKFYELIFSPFEYSFPGNNETSDTGRSLQPKILVSNPHAHLSYSPPKPILDANKLYMILLQKPFLNNDSDAPAYRCRLIYISNPDKLCISALMRTAPQSQVNGFREFFVNYTSRNPTPSFPLRESQWVDTNFAISFNLPFFAIGTLNKGHNSTSKENKMIRRRYSVPFLNAKNHKSPFPQDRIYLCEAVYSTMVTGENDHCWTAVCFRDEYLNNEQTYNDQEGDADTSEYEIDPIIAKHGTEAAEIMRSPRLYYLTALSVALGKIVGYHCDVQEHLRASLDSYTSDIKLNSADKASPPATRQWRRSFRDVLSQATYINFNIFLKVNELLDADLMCSPEGLLLSPIWAGIQTDSNTLEALHSIRNSRQALLQLNSKLNELSSTYDEFKQRDDDFHHRADVTKEQQTHTNTLAAFVFGILSLVAQVYAGRPERDHETSWPVYLTMVACFIVLNLIGLWAVMKRRRNI